MSAITRALLDDLTPSELAELAERLRPFLQRAEPPKRKVTPAEAAAHLGWHPKTLTRAAANGRVRGAERVGRSWRFVLEDLEIDPPAGTPIPPASTSRPRVRTADAADAIRGKRAHP